MVTVSKSTMLVSFSMLTCVNGNHHGSLHVCVWGEDGVVKPTKVINIHTSICYPPVRHVHSNILMTCPEWLISEATFWLLRRYSSGYYTGTPACGSQRVAPEMSHSMPVLPKTSECQLRQIGFLANCKQLQSSSIFIK